MVNITEEYARNTLSSSYPRVEFGRNPDGSINYAKAYNESGRVAETITFTSGNYTRKFYGENRQLLRKETIGYSGGFISGRSYEKELTESGKRIIKAQETGDFSKLTQKEAEILSKAYYKDYEKSKDTSSLQLSSYLLSPSGRQLMTEEYKKLSRPLEFTYYEKKYESKPSFNFDTSLLPSGNMYPTTKVKPPQKGFFLSENQEAPTRTFTIKGFETPNISYKPIISISKNEYQKSTKGMISPAEESKGIKKIERYLDIKGFETEMKLSKGQSAFSVIPLTIGTTAYYGGKGFLKGVSAPFRPKFYTEELPSTAKFIGGLFTGKTQNQIYDTIGNIRSQPLSIAKFAGETIGYGKGLRPYSESISNIKVKGSYTNYNFQGFETKFRLPITKKPIKFEYFVPTDKPISSGYSQTTTSGFFGIKGKSGSVKGGTPTKESIRYKNIFGQTKSERFGGSRVFKSGKGFAQKTGVVKGTPITEVQVYTQGKAKVTLTEQGIKVDRKNFVIKEDRITRGTIESKPYEAKTFKEYIGSSIKTEKRISQTFKTSPIITQEKSLVPIYGYNKSPFKKIIKKQEIVYDVKYPISKKEVSYNPVDIFGKSRINRPKTFLDIEKTLSKGGYALLSSSKERLIQQKVNLPKIKPQQLQKEQYVRSEFRNILPNLEEISKEDIKQPTARLDIPFKESKLQRGFRPTMQERYKKRFNLLRLQKEEKGYKVTNKGSLNLYRNDRNPVTVQNFEKLKYKVSSGISIKPILKADINNMLSNKGLIKTETYRANKPISRVVSNIRGITKQKVSLDLSQKQLQQQLTTTTTTSATPLKTTITKPKPPKTTRYIYYKRPIGYDFKPPKPPKPEINLPKGSRTDIPIISFTTSRKAGGDIDTYLKGFSKRDFRYTPTVGAAVFKLKGNKEEKERYTTGLSLRPVTI